MCSINFGELTRHLHATRFDAALLSRPPGIICARSAISLAVTFCRHTTIELRHQDILATPTDGPKGNLPLGLKGFRIATASL